MNQKQRKKLLTDNGFTEEEAEIISKYSVNAKNMKGDAVNKVISSLDPDGRQKIERATNIFNQMLEFLKNKNGNNLNE
jgi:hypothetical protein